MHLYFLHNFELLHFVFHWQFFTDIYSGETLVSW